MGLQLTIPFTMSEDGSVQTESTIDIQTSQRIRALVGTEPGQRAMRADLGIPLSRMLFGVGDTLIDAELHERVSTQLATYEPGTQVLTISPLSDNANDGVAELQVDFAPLLQASPDRVTVDSAIIEIGGTIKEIPTNG